MKNSLVPLNHYKFSLIGYLRFTLKLSLKLIINILSDKYIPKGSHILQFHSDDIMKSYNNYLRITKDEKDTFDTNGTVVECSIIKSRSIKNINNGPIIINTSGKIYENEV